ncbi:MAG TPA: hypothetical protein VHJ76_01005 [Actinomycetota bacterium]|nr:hypothetical protein [Actinomycetota bacterium]
MRRFRWLVVAGIVAATALPAAPAGAADTSALATCRSDVSLHIHEWHQTVVLAGTFVAPGATSVDLFCGIVRYGETVGGVRQATPGSVGVVAGTDTVLGGPISTCYEATVTYIDRVATFGNCP